MRGQGLNDLPRCELERQSSHHKEIFFEVPISDFEVVLGPWAPAQHTAGRTLSRSALPRIDLSDRPAADIRRHSCMTDARTHSQALGVSLRRA